MAYRNFLPQDNGLFYDYTGLPSTMPTTNAPLSAMRVQSGSNPGFMPTVMPSFNAPGFNSGAGGGATGDGATGDGSGSASASGVSGVGMGSIGANLSSGTVSGAIAAAMGLAGMAAPGIGMVSGIPSIVAMMGLRGIGNMGYAFNNARSTNNVAHDVEQMEQQQQVAEEQNTPNPTPNPEADPAPAADPSNPGDPSPEGGQGNSAAAASTATGDPGPGTGNSAADASAAAASDGGGDGGDGYSRGGRAYMRFADGGAVMPRRPLRKAYQRQFPDIWEDPRWIAKEANERVAPEDPAMERLWGYNRDRLYEEFANRKGNVEGRSLINLPAKPRGSDAVDRLMTPGNEQRIIDTLAEAGKYPDLHKGMDSWYAMDPVYRRTAELEGPDMAEKLYRRFNTLSGMASPGSNVNTEINRGTAANSLADQGRFWQFQRYAGEPAEMRDHEAPSDMSHVMGHPYHPTAQVRPMAKFLDTDEVNMTKPKVPLYIGASGVPETGFQTDMPVPDSHFARGIGLADTRTDSNPGRSLNNAEYAAVGPWFRDRIASPLGLESVPAQARQWGVMGHATGVDTPVGAPKLELLSRYIMNRAHSLGVSPETMRDGVITGKMFAEGGTVRDDMYKERPYSFDKMTNDQLLYRRPGQPLPKRPANEWLYDERNPKPTTLFDPRSDLR